VCACGVRAGFVVSSKTFTPPSHVVSAVQYYDKDGVKPVEPDSQDGVPRVVVGATRDMARRCR
jgi:hypothetical protein